MTKAQEPNWHSTKKDGKIEIRTYEPMIVAEVTVAGKRQEAISEGFRILAKYIFGHNMSHSVIAMTAPVMQKASENEGEWKIRFSMPAEYKIDTLPHPNDERIRLIEIPSFKTGVIRFSGFNTDKNIKDNQSELQKWLGKNKVKAELTPTYAFYDPPWTLPFLKRNEVMMSIS